MASRAVASRAARIKTKLFSELKPVYIEVEYVSNQHAGHAAMKDNGFDGETHFNVKIVFDKFDNHSLVNRHCMVYRLINDEIESGLPALSIVAKTPKEA